MKIKFFLIICIFWSHFGLSQDLITLPVESNSAQVRAVNLHENGIMVLNKYKDNILIQKIDTSLHTVWEQNTQVPDRAEFIDEYFDGKFLYIILQARNSRNYTILKISSSFPAYQKFDFPIAKNFQYGFFKANDKMICIGGSAKNEPFVAILDIVNGTPKYISQSSKGIIELQEIHIEDDLVHVTLTNTHKKVNQIILREYDINGRVLGNQNIKAKENHTFLSAKAFERGERHLLVGNYGIGKATRDGFQSSQGIFVSDLEKNKTDYYDFGNFKNLFGFLSERQRERLDRQVQRKKEKGGEYRFDYRLFISSLEFKDDQTFLVGEVLKTEFRSRNYGGMYGLYPSSFYWGRPAFYNYYWLNRSFYGYNYRNSEIFDGFRYLEGVIFSIDDDGKLVWDDSFQYKNLKYYDLMPHLKLSYVEDDILAIYTNSSKLNIEKIDAEDGHVLENREFDSQSLDLKFEGKKSEFSNFEHWYGNVYYNWGVKKESGGNICFIQKLQP